MHYFFAKFKLVQINIITGNIKILFAQCVKVVISYFTKIFFFVTLLCLCVLVLTHATITFLPFGLLQKYSDFRSCCILSIMIFFSFTEMVNLFHVIFLFE